ncbi:Mitochondrial distribution and morphology protein 10 [Malassezia arunalokei]|uniref:Mitochondrial distribution and morphology protein 10 n=1 Tax=Malassezia arunalokei TaxID=1514897 RepID=A0AAJ6CLN5_9BASI|nr:Mitochondrial distribution and morphology protein 10 [Malassezia arunalokei]
MMGYLRADYIARVDDDLMIGTRFDLNAYSYQSDWTLGAEYILRRSPEEDTNEGPSSMRERVGVWVNPNSTSNVSLRDHELPPAPPPKPHQVPSPQSGKSDDPESDATALSATEPSASTSMFLGLLKARLSMSGVEIKYLSDTQG